MTTDRQKRIQQIMAKEDLNIEQRVEVIAALSKIEDIRINENGVTAERLTEVIKGLNFSLRDVALRCIAVQWGTDV